jgi:hypothetical protein
VHNTGDSLLYVLSAKGEMSWADFKKCFDYLVGMQREPNEVESEYYRKHRRRETLLGMEALGHCDAQFESSPSKISVAPAGFVRLPQSGLPQIVLAGNRSPSAIEILDTYCKKVSRQIRILVSEQPVARSLIPNRVLITAESVDQISEISRLIGVAFDECPAAWSISTFCASLDQYLASRNWSSGTEPNLKRRDFDLGSLGFLDYRRDKEQWRLSGYTDRIRSTQLYFLWKDGSYAHVDLDWGRYAIAQEAGVSLLIYDERRFIVAVPAGAPLPKLFTRSLALCSGYTGHFVPGTLLSVPSPETRGFHLFKDIPPQIAEMVAAKLGQTLLPYSIDID